MCDIDIFGALAEAAEEVGEQQKQAVDLGPISELADKQSRLDAKENKTIARLIYDHAINMGASVKDVEGALKLIKKDLFDVKQNQLPELMGSFGLTEVTTDNGAKITIKDGLSPTVKDAEKLYDFVREIGDGAIIKDNVTVSLNEEVADSLFEVLVGLDLEYDRKQGIHAATLKKWCKDKLADGVNLPEAISVFEYKYAQLKK